MKRMGIFSSLAMAIIIPPFAVPSSLVNAMPVTPTASLKSLAWLSACCPVEASSTSRFSCGAPGSSLAATLWTFLSSSIRFTLVWSLPAVSRITTSDLLASAAFMASKMTAPGSPPCV